MIRLAPEDDYVTAFGEDFRAGRDGREAFLEITAVVGEVTGGFEGLAVEGEVAVKGGHYILEEGAEGGGAGDAFAVGLQEDGVRGVELQDGIELLGAKGLDPGFADLGEVRKSGGLRRGAGGRGKAWREDGREGQDSDGGAERTKDARRFDGSSAGDVHEQLLSVAREMYTRQGAGGTNS